MLHVYYQKPKLKKNHPTTSEIKFGKLNIEGEKGWQLGEQKFLVA